MRPESPVWYSRIPHLQIPKEGVEGIFGFVQALPRAFGYAPRPHHLVDGMPVCLPRFRKHYPLLDVKTRAHVTENYAKLVYFLPDPWNTRLGGASATVNPLTGDWDVSLWDLPSGNKARSVRLEVTRHCAVYREGIRRYRDRIVIPPKMLGKISTSLIPMFKAVYRMSDLKDTPHISLMGNGELEIRFHNPQHLDTVFMGGKSTKELIAAARNVYVRLGVPYMVVDDVPVLL